MKQMSTAGGHAVPAGQKPDSTAQRKVNSKQIWIILIIRSPARRRALKIQPPSITNGQAAIAVGRIQTNSIMTPGQ